MVKLKIKILAGYFKRNDTADKLDNAIHSESNRDERELELENISMHILLNYKR